MLISVCCTTNPLAGSLLPASNYSFNYRQPEARRQHFYPYRQLCPETLSACKAPVIQPWNSPHGVTSVSSCFHHLSFTLCSCVSVLLHRPKLSCIYSPPSFISTCSTLLLPSCDFQPRPQRLLKLRDTGFGFNGFCPPGGNWVPLENVHMECECGCVLICVRGVSTLRCSLSPAMEVSLIYSSSPFHPCWPPNRGTSCKQIEMNNVHFGASPTTYWWIQSVCFNYNFPKNLPNLSKSFPVSCGLWRKNELLQADLKQQLFVGREGICTRVSVCIYLEFI